MGKPDAPQPPNPYQVAAAQTGTNVATGVANSFLNNINQNTPTGSLSYDVTGNYSWQDPSTGHTYNIPRFTATQTLTPDQQALQDINEQTQLNLGNLANQQSQKLSQHLAGSVDLSNAPAAGSASSITDIPGATTQLGDAGNIARSFGGYGDITTTYGPADNFSADRARVEEALYGRLNPQLARERSNIEQRLADQGIRYGSQAYNAAMDDYNRQANDLRLGVTQTAGAEQQRMMDMEAKRAGFENAAQQQAYQQAQGLATFENTAQQQAFNEALSRGQFYNAGLAQQVQTAQAGFNAANAARNQYLQEQYTARNQPIQETSALMSGSQVTNPNFLNTPGSQIANTDFAGIMQNNFRNQQANYQSELGSWNQVMGGLFGLGSNLLTRSDERTKENVVPMGSVLTTKPDNDNDREASRTARLPIYEYSYKDDPAHRRHVGPMAQDVERIDPRAVVRDRRGIRYIDRRRVMGGIMGAAHG